MVTWRLPESEAVYSKFRLEHAADFQNGCLICQIPVKQRIGEFNIIPNQFPYDAVSTLNDMLVLAVHQSLLTPALLGALECVKMALAEQDTYDLMLENFPRKKTIPSHWHIHLLRLRPLEEVKE